MAETKSPGAPPPADGPSREQLEERWKEVIDTLGESPRNVDLLVKAGQLSEQLQRPLEAYTYFEKALNLDPSKAFLVSKMKTLAVTPEQKERATRMARRPASFEASLRDIFKYPVRGKGLPVLIIGAIFLWIARALMANGIGGSGITIAALAGAYMAMFYIDVCHTTVGGEDELPDWPDPLRINEFAVDVLKFVCATVAAFLPVVAIIIFLIASLGSSSDGDEMPSVLIPPPTARPHPIQDSDPDDEPAHPAPAPHASAPAAPVPPPPPPVPSFPFTLMLGLVGIALFSFVGLLYLPMAKLVNVVMGSPWTCFNYPFVVHSILATPRNYVICLVCYFGTTVVLGVAEVAVQRANVIVFTGCGLAFLELYGMTVLMRLLGLFYRMNQAKLGWMAD
jgi:hypothetical protein